MKGKEAKLANANFVDRAPAEVVQKEREALAEAEQKIAAIDETLAALRR